MVQIGGQVEEGRRIEGAKAGMRPYMPEPQNAVRECICLDISQPRNKSPELANPLGPFLLRASRKARDDPQPGCNFTVFDYAPSAAAVPALRVGKETSKSGQKNFHSPSMNVLGQQGVIFFIRLRTNPACQGCVQLGWCALVRGSDSGQ